MIRFFFISLTFALFAFYGCTSNERPSTSGDKESSGIQKRLDKYVKVKLKADVSHLSQNQKEMVILLIEASKFMDTIFW